jgi:hypothetical protein
VIRADGAAASWAVGVAVAAALLLVVLLLLRWRAGRGAEVILDGSNVMHWGTGAPSLDTVRRVVEALEAQGLRPGIVFDANAGWKLFGRYVDDAEFARALGLKASRVLVVPKGTPADPVILQAARDRGARVVTNDRFRDWAGQFPEIAREGRLVRGRMRPGGVDLRL